METKELTEQENYFPRKTLKHIDFIAWLLTHNTTEQLHYYLRMFELSMYKSNENQETSKKEETDPQTF